MKKIEAETCYHPELFPTDWDQKKPAPCKMVVMCECGERQSCPICGWGKGSYPCSCMRERRELKERESHYGDYYSKII